VCSECRRKLGLPHGNLDKTLPRAGPTRTTPRTKQRKAKDDPASFSGGSRVPLICEGIRQSIDESAKKLEVEQVPKADTLRSAGLPVLSNPTLELCFSLLKVEYLVSS